MTILRTPDYAPAAEPGGKLHTIRDVVAIIRDVLLIILLLATLYMGGSLVTAIGESVDPQPTQCVGDKWPC